MFFEFLDQEAHLDLQKQSSIVSFLHKQSPQCHRSCSNCFSKYSIPHNFAGSHNFLQTPFFHSKTQFYEESQVNHLNQVIKSQAWKKVLMKILTYSGPFHLLWYLLTLKSFNLRAFFVIQASRPLPQVLKFSWLILLRHEQKDTCHRICMYLSLSNFYTSHILICGR